MFFHVAEEPKQDPLLKSGQRRKFGAGNTPWAGVQRPTPARTSIFKREPKRSYQHAEVTATAQHFNGSDELTSAGPAPKEVLASWCWSWSPSCSSPSSTTSSALRARSRRRLDRRLLSPQRKLPGRISGGDPSLRRHAGCLVQTQELRNWVGIVRARERVVHSYVRPPARVHSYNPQRTLWGMAQQRSLSITQERLVWASEAFMAKTHWSIPRHSSLNTPTACCSAQDKYHAQTGMLWTLMSYPFRTLRLFRPPSPQNTNMKEDAWTAPCHHLTCMASSRARRTSDERIRRFPSLGRCMHLLARAPSPHPPHLHRPCPPHRPFEPPANLFPLEQVSRLRLTSTNPRIVTFTSFHLRLERQHQADQDIHWGNLQPTFESRV